MIRYGQVKVNYNVMNFYPSWVAFPDIPKSKISYEKFFPSFSFIIQNRRNTKYHDERPPTALISIELGCTEQNEYVLK